jgi:hypothetical protein
MNKTFFQNAFKPNNNPKTQYDINLSNTAPIILSIDSKFRNRTLYPNQNKYSIILDQSYREIVSIELTNIIIPNLIYNINNYNNKLSFRETPNEIIDIIIPPGSYDIADLIDTIENLLNTSSYNGATYQILVNNISHILTFTQLTPGTATIFELLFFGYNEKIDNTLIPQYKDNSIGQILGFQPDNYSGSVINSIYPYSLNQLTYLNLYVNKNNKFRHIESNNDATKGCFCVIPITTNNNNSYIYNKNPAFINNAYIKEFIEPIPHLQQIDIEFRDQNNNLVDFNNQDHLLIFEIKQN